MIAFLHGLLKDKTAPKLILDVNGVGYEIEVSLTTLTAMPELDQMVLIYTQMIVREDAQLLYGFATLSEKSMFQTLIKINGVGAKMALAILSSISTDELAHAINNDDLSLLVKIPGVGKKTASRLIIEMKDKLDLFINCTNISNTKNNINEREAISALESLGYKSIEASQRVKSVLRQDMSVANIIKEALK